MTTDVSNIALTKDALLPLVKQMLLKRRMEERLSAGNLPGAVHLYIGQEVVAVGVCAHLQCASAPVIDPFTRRSALAHTAFPSCPVCD